MAACITARTCRNRHLMPSMRFPRERGGGEAFKAPRFYNEGRRGTIKPINMQRSGTVLLAHDADLRAADVAAHRIRRDLRLCELPCTDRNH